LTLTQVEADSNGAFGVVALNLFDQNGDLAQDQLAVDPGLETAPEPTTTSCFLLGVGALVGFQRLKTARRI
jgi:hypothetical protein